MWLSGLVLGGRGQQVWVGWCAASEGFRVLLYTWALKYSTGVIRACGVSVVVVALSIASHTLEAAELPKHGLGRVVHVACLKHTDTPVTRKAFCLEWVNLLNAQVSPYYQLVSDGSASFTFELAPYQLNAPPWDATRWIQIPWATTTNQFHLSRLQEGHWQIIDQFIDFTTVNALLIISAGDGFFGQAPGSPFQPSRSTLMAPAWPVGEGGEVSINGQWNRLVSVVLAGESNSRNSPDPLDMDIVAAIVSHEFGHLYHFRDRYFLPWQYPGVNPRDYASGYSEMGATSTGNPHFTSIEKHWMGFAGPSTAPQSVVNEGSNLVAYDLVVPTKVNPPAQSVSLLRIPIEGSGATIESFRGYTVEARIRDTTGPLKDWVAQTGVVVTFFDHTLDGNQVIRIMDDPDLPGNLAEAALEVADVIEDQAYGVRIEVAAAIADGFRVRVTNTIPGGLQPDVSIRNWNQDGQLTWTTPDIWIDRESNGFNVFDADGTDAPAIRLNTSLPEQKNRVHFRVVNLGSANAQNYSASAFFAAPGINQGSWQQIGNPKPIPNLSAYGGVFSDHFEWVLPDSFAGGLPHACIKIVITGPGADANDANQIAQENIFEYETIHESPWHPRGRVITVTNTSTSYGAYVGMQVFDLPVGWAVALEPRNFFLNPSQTKGVNFMISPAGPPELPASGYDAGYVARVKAWANITHIVNGDSAASQTGGVTAQIRLTEVTSTSLTVVSAGTGVAVLKTCTTRTGSVPVSGRRIGLQYWKGGTVKWSHATTPTSGCVVFNLESLASGVWSAKGFLSGGGVDGSSTSVTKTFAVN